MAADLMDRTLRWMRENLEGAQNARHPVGHLNEGQPCTNSGTGILTLAYIEVLGKVLKKGRGGNGARFRRFVEDCMSDYLNAQSTQRLPLVNGRQLDGVQWLWTIYGTALRISISPETTVGFVERTRARIPMTAIGFENTARSS